MVSRTGSRGHPATFAILVAGALLASLAAPGTAEAFTPCGNYAYAAQNTAHSTASYQCPTDVYYGYIGVDGRIETPPALAPIANGSASHSVGYLDFNFNTNPITWVQTGWMMGGIDTYPGCTQGVTCLTSYNQYLLYLEKNEPGGFYFVTSQTSLSLANYVTYRIEYSSSDGCWLTYYNYNTLEDVTCNSFPGSGMAVAANETEDGGDGYSGMPYSIFGTATTGTNSTLRLRGASGWGDWTSAVSTATVNSRPYYYYSFYQKWYHFLTYGAVR